MDKDTIPTFENIIKKVNDYNLVCVNQSEPFTDVLELPFEVKKLLNISAPCSAEP